MQGRAWQDARIGMGCGGAVVTLSGAKGTISSMAPFAALRVTLSPTPRTPESTTESSPAKALPTAAGYLPASAVTWPCPVTWNGPDPMGIRTPSWLKPLSPQQ